MLRNKRYNAYSVVPTHGKWPRVDFAFARQPWAIKSTTRTELRNETIVRVVLLIIKCKIVCGISSCKIQQNTRLFDTDYNATSVQRCRRCTFDSPGLASAYPGLCMLCGSQRRRCCAFSEWNAVIKYRGIKGTTPTALFPLTANDPG